MMNRRTKRTLSTSNNLLKPRLIKNAGASIAKKQAKQQHYYNRGAETLGKLHGGDRIKVQPFVLEKKKWSDGKVIREVRPRSYEVEVNGRRYVRNRKHLRKCTATQEEEVEEDAYLPNPDYGREDNNQPQRAQQVKDGTQTPAERKLPVEPVRDQEYRTCSGRVSKRPVRFGELTDE